MELGLSGKKVLVTGSSRGIGEAIALGFLKEGADIAMVARNSNCLNDLAKDFKKKFGVNRVISFKCDCTNEDNLISMRQLVKEKWGSIDIVIANVGDGRSEPDVIPSANQWKKTWDSNFESALLTARTFLPMLEESNGVLLFISSIAGMEAFGAPTDYSTAKTAVIALAKNISRKLAPNIRVNVISPGNVYFEGGSWHEKIKKDKANVDKIIKTEVPLNRFATPTDIANSAIFLCSNKASFINGTNLVIDGGQTIGVV